MGSFDGRLRAGVPSRVPLVVLSALATLSCGDGPTTPVDAGIPVSVAAVDGDAQQGIVGDTLARRPTVRVLDRAGSPVAGADVLWQVAESNGAVLESSGPTSEDGTHSAVWRLGNGAGEQRITARVAGLAPVAFRATAGAGPTVRVQVTLRDLVLVLEEGLDEATVGASALDQFDNPTGDPIEWSVPDDKVAVVDQAGVVRAVGAGYSSVQARVGTVVGGASLTVANPVPLLQETSPGSAAVGTPGMTVALIGSGFVPQSVVFWNDSYRPKTLLSRTRIEIHASPEDLAEAGTASIRIVNSTPGGGSSGSVDFVIEGTGSPAIGSIAPATIQAGWGSFTLTVRGTDFVPQSRVLWTGVPLETLYIGSTELRATIPSSYVAFEGSADIQVETPTPVHVISNTMTFTIFSPPAFSVEIMVPGNTLLVDNRIRLAAVARNQFGEIITDKVISWSSDDTTMAKIDGEYLVGLKPGMTQIVASAHPIHSTRTFFILEAPAPALVFEAAPTGQPELFARSLAPAGGVRRLLPPGTFGKQPSPSADGSRLAFVGRDGTGNEDIYVVNRDGSGMLRLTTEEGLDDQPAWSPDGQSIAFRSFRHGKSDIWLMNADGSNQRNLTFASVFIPEEYNDRPAWSPDSQTLVFSRGLGLRQLLFKVGADGAGLSEFLSWSGLDLLEPAWSPDGLSIAFRTYDRTARVSSVQVVSAETGQEVYYAFEPPPMGARSPAWLDDGWMAVSAPLLPGSPDTPTVALVRLGFGNVVVPMGEEYGTLGEPAPLW